MAAKNIRPWCKTMQRRVIQCNLLAPRAYDSPEPSARPSAHHAADETLLEAREAETFAPQRRVLLLEQPHVAREGVAFGRQLGEHL